MSEHTVAASSVEHYPAPPSPAQRQARRSSQKASADQYESSALHSELFRAEFSRRWLLPGIREALARWQETGDVQAVDLAALPGVRLEAPGVLSFDCLTTEYCDMLLAETRHYRESGFPQYPPNSMNNYGLVLNEIGMRPAFTAFLQDYLLGIGARLFGEDEVRQSHLGSSWLGTEDWGGSSLSAHHTFVVRYQADEDRHLDMHVDECDVTFNFGLTDCDDFEGSDLAFCGMLGAPDNRKHSATYKHSQGRCVVHCGKQRHGALNIVAGERASLIMWTKSENFRASPVYRQRALAMRARAEVSRPDPVCLSYTHDQDYSRWTEAPSMRVLVRGKVPGVDVELEVGPHLMVRHVAEILCYGTSRRGGSWVGWRDHGGTPPLAILMRLSFRGHRELAFDRTLEFYGIGSGDVIDYSPRAARLSAVFCTAWDRLNGECVYSTTRCGLTSGAETGLLLRRSAHRIVQLEHGDVGVGAVQLTSVRTGERIGDDASVREFLDSGESLLRVRIDIDPWARRRRIFLIARKGNPLLMADGSFTLAHELKLLLFLQLYAHDIIFKLIATFL